MAIEFEWDRQKARANLINHKISFGLATEIFTGPRLEVLDSREGYGEERYISLGAVSGRCLVVVYTIRNTRIRIISARKATKSEQGRYLKEIHGEA